MTLLSTLLAFVIALSLLITFHEFGHYLVARWSGVKVLRFSIGFGRPVYKRKWGQDQTEWVVAAIPLGGYVKMLDEREGSVPRHELTRAFNRQPVLKRFAIVAAGPLANFLLAILLYWALFVVGVTGMKPVLGDIQPMTLAATAGLHVGETITKIDNQPVATWQDVRLVLLDRAVDRDATVRLEVMAENGVIHKRTLDLSTLHPDELNADFLGKIGLSVYRPVLTSVIGQVIAGSAADKTGLQAEDEILAIDGKEILYWDEVVSEIRASPERELEIEVLRDKSVMKLILVPEKAREDQSEIGKAGIAPKIEHAALENLLITISYSPFTALVKAIAKTWDMTYFTLRMLGKMMTGDVSLKNVSGPITIADYAGQSAQMGIVAYLGFLALVSVSLGVLNLLPIPVLDGGHLMYYVIEMIRGAPLSERVMEIGHQIGMGLLVTLMLFALHNDLLRLISG
ncbi:RIP metalloprotease RseP [Nitrosomonas mobilis]|uniref:Zinc metalloprotease n=1 Tax=Nitrosomonas mobilis TaxID=51642 RepID=A0A1G5SF51_9PROT|nr:RIP metalloprotease RseP [Nitrosomonas mobilis]SCZ85470.1 zinc metallopeptidase [Nitrosomonas mobilis]HNO74523.1 RIP metalloprotease RseP [Nitrosomonas mobilis]